MELFTDSTVRAIATNATTWTEVNKTRVDVFVWTGGSNQRILSDRPGDIKTTSTYDAVIVRTQNTIIH